MNSIALENVCEIKSGRGFKQGVNEREDGVYVVQMSDVTGGNTEIDWSKVIKAEVSFRTHKLLKNGDILFLAKGKTYKALTVTNLSGEAVAANHFFVLSVREQLVPDFLTMQLNSSSIQQYLNEHASGDKKKHITKATLSELEIGLCDMATQKKLIDISKSIECDIRKIENDYNEISSLLDLHYQSENQQTLDTLEELMRRDKPSFFSSYMDQLHSIINREAITVEGKSRKKTRVLL